MGKLPDKKKIPELWPFENLDTLNLPASYLELVA